MKKRIVITVATAAIFVTTAAFAQQLSKTHRELNAKLKPGQHVYYSMQRGKIVAKPWRPGVRCPWGSYSACFKASKGLGYDDGTSATYCRPKCG